MRAINYHQVLENVDTMINTLEWDAMRSAGKTKQAILELDAMYNMKDRYEAMLRKPGPKATPKKEG